MQKIEVFRIATGSPDDVSGLARLLDEGTLKAEDIICVLGKTEGNGCVNDFTRGFATLACALLLAERMGVSPEEVTRRVAFIMSGGTEGVMSPHLTVFARREVPAAPAKGKRLAAGTAFTRDFVPEEIGTMVQVREVARAVRTAMGDAEIHDPADVHFVQIKCPLLTADRIQEAERRGKEVVVHDTYKSMGYSRGASALGVALALGEVDGARLGDEAICRDFSLYSGVASTSAGVELKKCEIILLGNSADSASDLLIGHAVMRDAIDADAVKEALRSAGLKFDCCPSRGDLARVVNVFAKAEASTSGTVRGRRHVMLDDSDINHTRHARAVVNAVIASIVGDPMVYVSGGAEHQGPDGGGPVAAIVRAG
ncbi:MAG: ring-opening amidohydrolase [Bacillota bacterium]|nr:ring-opening amidohydrolase [Bacillota bacterium]